MKTFVILATLVAAISARGVFLPLPEIGVRPELPEIGNRPELPEIGNRPELPEIGNRPELLPPAVDPIFPEVPEIGNRPELPEIGNRPELLPPAVDPIFPEVPEIGNKPELLPPLRPLPPGLLPEVPMLPPGVLPEVPIVPPKPELPGPRPPMEKPSVHSEILNFPSDDDPQIRIHVNIKESGHSNVLTPPVRSIRSLLTFDNIRPRPPMVEETLPPVGNRPEILPPTGNFPELSPELPEIGNKPELLPPPEISFPTPEITPPESDGIYTFIYPNIDQQLVKLRVVYNKPAEIVDLPAPEWAPYKLEFPQIGNKLPLPEELPGNKPALPEMPGGILPEVPGERPIIPMPMPPSGGQKVPEVELFLDIGEPDVY